jgi:TolB-like protein
MRCWEGLKIAGATPGRVEVQFLFEDHILDVDRRELRRGSQQIPVGPQVFDLLVYLVQNRERVVTKDDLLDAVWSGRFVSESNLTTRINAARKAIRDSGEEQRLIRTVPRKGFRFVGAVSIAAEDATKEVPAHTATTQTPLPLPDKPSIAVLPFDNISGDPEQEYFADGMVEEIITALSRFRQLFVIARNSTFTYKGRAVDVKQIGRELGVRYVLEGSVRKAVNRVRITTQLVDALTGAHVWADRFDGTLEDIFELQDKVAGRVVAAIGPKLERAEIERSSRKPTGSQDAYDYYLRAMAFLYQWRSRDACDRAIQASYKAIELDPDFATPYGIAALCFSWRKSNGWMVDRAQETEEADRLVHRAAELGEDDAVALSYAGYSLAYVLGDLDSGFALLDRALLLNPNMAIAWTFSGWVKNFRGEWEAAIKHLTYAIRLSPLDPMSFRMHGGMAFAHFLSGRYDEAVLGAEKALHVQPSYQPALRILAASHALIGRLEQAHQAVARLRQNDPALRVSTVKGMIPFHQPEHLARYEDGLRKAGLPE